VNGDYGYEAEEEEEEDEGYGKDWAILFGKKVLSARLHNLADNTPLIK